MPPRKRSRVALDSAERPESQFLEGSGIPRDDPGPSGDDERGFRCRFCAKAFHRKEHLQRHERLHTKEKPFKCTICSAGFARRDLLARHVRLTHESDSPSRFETEPSNTSTVNGQNLSPTGASPTVLNSISPSELRAQNPEVPKDGTAGFSSDETPTGNGFLPYQPSPGIQFSATPRASVMLPFPNSSPATALDLSSAQQADGFGDFDLFIDSINGTYGNGLSSFYVDEPILPSPPAPLFPSVGLRPQIQSFSPSSSRSNQIFESEPRLFDEFTSELPSFEPSRTPTARKEPGKITQQDWDFMSFEVQKFAHVISRDFFLPSRHTMSRYINTYFAGFHRHLPLIHFPTFSATQSPIELVLAMATIGAISAFDKNNATMLFRASLTISQERLFIRKKQRHEAIYDSHSVSPDRLQKGIMQNSSVNTKAMQSEAISTREGVSQFDPLPLAQALLILMAMATWGNSEAIFDEAIGIQNILANHLRAEKLLEAQISSAGSTWVTWIKEERFRRTIAIIFCFFIFHTIVYDIPPSILNSELNIQLPSREKDWEAKTETEWRQARSKHETEPQFQVTFAWLFTSKIGNNEIECSSLGSYTLILAIIQHIYFLRTVAKHKPGGEQGLSTADMAEIEQALKNWQSGWNQDPESFLGPGSPLGPISFNSTALLRMAYIRLNVDLGPWRALNTHIPHEIAASMHRSPPIATNRRLSRAVLYSAHALSIPVKIGINIVAHNQAFSWSLQHSLCALECAFIISKWLIAIQPHVSGGSIDEEEARLYAYIVDMVTEAEAGGDIESYSTDLCVRVVRIWARTLSGMAHWNVVPMIGKVLEAYASIMESPTT